MKAFPAALFTAAFCLFARAAEESPMKAYFISEPLVASFDTIHETPVVLLLEAQLRAELLAQWRSLTPETESGRRMKGLLLEDSGDPRCQEWLGRNPGDKVRLLWRAGKTEEARIIWESWKGGRSEQAAAAILPVVAKGDANEIARFRDFLLAPLSAKEVVGLCRDVGLPEELFKKIEVKRKWLKLFPLLASAEQAKLPDALRLAISLESKQITRAEFEEIRGILKSPERTRQERVQVLEGLAGDPGYRHMEETISGILLCDWLESHPDEVAEVLVEFTGRGLDYFARSSGLPGILCLHRELEQRPGNRAVALSLALALRGWEETPDEITRVWRLAMPLETEVPSSSPWWQYPRTGPTAGNFEEIALEFAAKNLPERDREKWMTEWLGAAHRTSGESARMAAWLSLGGHFWRAWPEALKIQRERRMLLECIASGRVGASRYDQRKSIEKIFAEFADEVGVRGLRGALGIGEELSSPYGRRIVMASEWPGIPAPHLSEIILVRYLLANALAVANPLRQSSRISGLDLERNGGFALHGFFASDPDHQGNGFSTPIFGRPDFGLIVPPRGGYDLAAIDRWLARVDRGRLSRKSLRSLEVAKVAFCSPMDQQASEVLRGKLNEWWEQDRDPDAGKMLLSFRRARAQWPEWEGLWKEVAAAMPPHERMKFAEHLKDRLRQDQHDAVNVAAALDLSPNPDWMIPRLGAENPNLRFPYRDAGKAEGFLGRRLWSSPWVAPDDEESLQMVQRARREGLETVKAMGASDLELAMNRARLFSLRGEPASLQTILDSGRLTADMAMEIYPDLRGLKHPRGARLCLDLLSDHKPGKTVDLLDDPWLMEVFELQELEAWALRVFDVSFRDREISLPHLVGFMTRLVKEGNHESATRIALACSIFNSEVVALLPPGEKRRELLAAWLTSKPEELRPDFRRHGSSVVDWKKLPELSPGEWREVAALLVTEDRWEIRKPHSNNDFALLYAVISAGVNDATEALELGGMDTDAMADLLGRAASASFGNDEFPAKIRGLVLGLAGLDHVPEHSGALLQMLTRYPVEDADIASAFRVEAKIYGGSPTDEVLKRILRYGEVDLATAMAKRMPEKGNIVGVVLARSSIFTEFGHQKDAWTLVVSQWPAIRERVANQPGYIRRLLPLARQAEDIGAVRDLVNASPDPNAVEVVEGLKWLRERVGE